MTKKIFISGCGGMLGDAFYKVFQKEYELMCTDIDVNEGWLSYLDFRDFNKYLETSMLKSLKIESINRISIFFEKSL